ncbi:MAG TPA: thiamine pyrophosphate-dependent dehydrogenase E1 component subunit alpha [Candidatus Acidoferrum sp.]|nr:thiamine pyrophosphate-dependent dehydrogenase E1 component subunit alpha [Candidatus Acidoferrum sp.]
MREKEGQVSSSGGEMDGAGLLGLYKSMLRIRVAEESIAELLEKNEIRCPTHLYTGQEAIASGVCAALTREDYIFGGHRSHGHYLAKGGDLRSLMAELYGKAAGCARGRGGSMHLIAPEVGLLGTVPLVAATIPIAAGAALASQLRGERRVSVAFFGDGATEEGHFHESLNLAGVRKLPVIFVCENNFYSSHMHITERRAKDNIHNSGEAHGIPGIVVDGNDAVAVYWASMDAVRRARNREGPTLLECRTYRWRGHVGPSMDMDVGVKRKDELKDWLPKDPLARLRLQLLERGMQNSELEEMQRNVHVEVHAAIRWARECPFPPASELERHLFVQSGDTRHAHA